MMRWIRRVLLLSTCTLLLCGGLQVAAQASVARVSGVNVGAQNRCAGMLRVKWHAVKGASYQVRWASAKSRLAAARPLPVGRHVATIGPVSVSGPTFIQVRAVRHGKAGAWSKTDKARFSSSGFAQPCDLSGQGVPGGVQFTWSATPGASGYRVRWAAAPHGVWPESASYVSGWLPGSARSSVFAVPATPQPGDHMLGVAYANPVWGQLEARNSKGTVRHSAGWVPVFPAAPDPGTGDALRIGTYNVMLDPTGTRAQAIAENIRSHGVGVAALQESNGASALAVAQALGRDWDYTPKNPISSPQTIVFRTTSYRLVGSNVFEVRNPKQPSVPIKTPWAKLQPVNGTAKSQPFYVVSAHVTEDDSKSVAERKGDAGLIAQDLMNGINDAMNRNNDAGRPVIVAGDLHYLREPFGDVAGQVEAPPTLVRGGYYDAMAALSKTNIDYPTFNGGQHEDVAQTGVSPRADYLMLKGFRGSNAYVNVANWTYGGSIPSDHNLVYADVTVPFGP